MNLKSLTHAQLIDDTHRVIKIERKATVAVIRRFREISTRELFLAEGYGTLFQMATELFGYSNASAQRRINAMELIIAAPEVECKLESQEICLQVAADIQTFLNLESKLKRPYSAIAISELVDVCSKKSVAAVRRELANRNPKIKFRETKRAISGDRFEIKYSITVALDEKHSRLKQIWSHINPSMTHEELVGKMTDLALKAVDPLQKIERAQNRQSKKSAVQTHSIIEASPVMHSKLSAEMQYGDEATIANSFSPAEITAIANAIPIPIKEFKFEDTGEIQFVINFEMLPDTQCASLVFAGADLRDSFPSEEMISLESVSSVSQTSAESKTRSSRSRYISAQANREALKQNQNRGCAFVNKQTGKRCGSKHLLQRDHIEPWSKGGSNAADNLRIYCGAHNRWRWRNRNGSIIRSRVVEYAG